MKDVALSIKSRIIKSLCEKKLLVENDINQNSHNNGPRSPQPSCQTLVKSAHYAHKDRKGSENHTGLLG